MTILRDRAELVAHLSNSVFVALLAANNGEDLAKIQLDDPDDDVGYQIDEESDSLDGLYLFSTPLKSNGAGPRYGLTVHVIKLFGAGDTPYRVEVSEDTPWGNGEDGEAFLGDYRTLGEAADLAFQVYERGDLKLDVLIEDENTGGYKKGSTQISIPEMNAPDPSL